jgi:hypothetical protein
MGEDASAPADTKGMRSTALAGVLASIVTTLAAPSGAVAATGPKHPHGGSSHQQVWSLAPRSTPMRRVKAYRASSLAQGHRGHGRMKPKPGMSGMGV